MNNPIQSCKEMEDILRSISWGFLAMTVDDRPYMIPLNYAYDSGRILFHCALEGKKLVCIRANPRVCFSVARQPGSVEGHPQFQQCHMDCESVVCFGTARIVDDLQQRAEVLNIFNRHFHGSDAPDLPEERIRRCLAVEISIQEMTGRRECNRKLTCWHHRY